MNLRDKLKRFASEKQPARIERQSQDLAQILHGEEISNVFGSYYLVENRYPVNYVHGFCTLGDVLKSSPTNLAFIAKDDSIEKITPEDTIFLDTETTGLSGGAGTFAFLIGVGFFSDNEFVIRQYFMRDYHEETALLYDLQELLGKCRAIVTFNGKSFDWPLIKARLIMNRFELPLDEYIQLDLLYPARRLWSKKLVACSLNSLEANILQVVRVNDIPGFEVPQRFFAYIQTKRGELLADIFVHNRIDILSLVSLMNYYSMVVETAPQNLNCPWESCALARLYEKNKDWYNAIRYYQRVIELGKPKSCCVLSLSRLGLIYRRLSQWNLAEEIWMILANEVQDIQSYEELAKYYEHVCRDYVKAKNAASQGLSLALAEDKLKVPDFQYRLKRLDRKIKKAMGGL